MLAKQQYITQPNKKPVVAVDWNSTLEDQIGEICRLSRGRLAPADFDRWDPPLGPRVGMSVEQFTAWAWTSPCIQWRARAYPGAAQAVAWLRRWAEVWIVTATCHPQLVEPWLKREGIGCDRIIFTQDKAAAEWDILIDDSPATLARLSELGRPVIRFALPWNAHLGAPGPEFIEGLPALEGWSNIQQIINKRKEFEQCQP